jgi:quinol monooxygenase YgiN
VSFLLQATTKLDDLEVLRSALEWLNKEVGHVEGLVSLRVFQAQDDASRITMLEEWENPEAFQKSVAAYSLEQRAEFLQRLGLNIDSFERSLWLSTGLEYS